MENVSWSTLTNILKKKAYPKKYLQERKNSCIGSLLR